MSARHTFVTSAVYTLGRSATLAVRSVVVAWLFALPCFATTVTNDESLATDISASVVLPVSAAGIEESMSSSAQPGEAPITGEPLAHSLANKADDQGTPGWSSVDAGAENLGLAARALRVVEPTTLGLLIGGLGLLLLRAWRAKL